jgi:hypothetical protein
MTAGQPAAGHHDPGSPSDSPTVSSAAAQAFSRLTELAKTSLKVQGSLTRQAVDLTWGTVVRDLDRVSANRAYVGSVARESARYWRTVGEVSVDCAGDLITMGRSLTVTILRGVASAGRIARTRNLSPQETASSSLGEVTPIRRARRRTPSTASPRSPRSERLTRAGGTRR